MSWFRSTFSFKSQLLICMFAAVQWMLRSIFDWEKKSPAAGSMCMTGMFKLSMNELESFYTHQTLSVIFYRGGLWIFHYVLYYNTYIVARWDNLCFRTTLQCCTAGVTPLYQYLMDSGMKHYNQLWENITYAN